METKTPESIVVVVGSTGVGKSKLAVDLSSAFGGEVINADALQVYKGLDVTTNKATPDETKGTELRDTRRCRCESFEASELMVWTRNNERQTLPVVSSVTAVLASCRSPAPPHELPGDELRIYSAPVPRRCHPGMIPSSDSTAKTWGAVYLFETCSHHSALYPLQLAP